MRYPHRYPDKETAPARAAIASLLLLMLAMSAAGQHSSSVMPGYRVVAVTHVSSGPLVNQDDGKALYEVACASCHGLDGRGAPRERVAFDTPVPDFADCRFASREPDADWIAVAHEGGPVRGFDPIMPAFGEAFSEEELAAIITYIRLFCADGSWPRGELNLPRPFVTEKAYPEDEAVTTLAVNAEGPGAVMNEVVYEKRFGPRNQIELKVPFGAVEKASPSASGWNAGLGDIAVGVKRALWHSLASGSILSAGAEVVLPTGSADRGLGTGTVVLEPFVSFGQIIAGDGFLHVQALAEGGVDADKAEREAALRAALGWSWTQGRFGRSWSPMIEVLSSGALEGGGIAVDLVPQMQVTLNTRQHVMINVGVRLPVNDASARSTRLLFYLLWDWFDGGLLEGW